MSAREELAALLGQHYGTSAAGDDYLWAMADIIMEKGWVKTRTITTTDEVEALLVDSVVKDRVGDIYERVENPDSERPVWRVPGIRGYLVTASILFPATVLHEGEAK